MASVRLKPGSTVRVVVDDTSAHKMSADAAVKEQSGNQQKRQ